MIIHREIKEIRQQGYKGKKIYAASLDRMDPIRVYAASEAAALVTAAQYYNIRWQEKSQRDRIMTWHL